MSVISSIAFCMWSSYSKQRLLLWTSVHRFIFRNGDMLCFLWGNKWILNAVADELHVPTRSRVFLGSETRVELVPKFHVALHALQTVTSIFGAEVVPSITLLNFSRCYTAHHSSFSIPERLTFYPTYLYQMASGHCLGTFMAENVSPFPPLNVASLTTTPLFSSHSFLRSFLEMDSLSCNVSVCLSCGPYGPLYGATVSSTSCTRIVTLLVWLYEYNDCPH